MNELNPSTVLLLLIVLVACAASCAFGLPVYGVWKAEKNGQARLMEAKQSRQIRIEEANAELEASKADAEAEVIRARGMAEAMEIENGALTPEYIQYLWVRKVDFGKSTTIYIPTEAGLPILEAGKRFSPGVAESQPSH